MGQRLALLVATSRYVDPGLRRLRAPVEEAKQLRELLQDPDIGEFDTTQVLVNESKAEIERRIEELFLHRQPDDLVLLYVSGHGIKNDYDHLFFAACNTELAKPRSTAVAASFVHDLLQECQAGVKAVMLDCCYSGAFSNEFIAKSASHAVDLEHQLAGKGTYVITATNELEYAYEGETLAMDAPQPQSVFTAALIEGLRSGDADADRDGLITADELYQYVYEVVQRDGRQTPTRIGKIQGSFVLAKVRTQPDTIEIKAAKDLNIPSPTLGQLLPRVAHHGKTVDPADDGAGLLQVPIGWTADTRDGAGDVAVIDLAGHTGHVVIVGRIYSGKTTLLRSLIIGLGLTYSHDDVQFYCLDSDSRLAVLDALPHVKSVAGPFDVNRVEAMLSTIEALIAKRHRFFHSTRIGSTTAYRLLRRRHRLPDGEHADVFLVIDGWDTLAQEVPGLERSVRKIASAGLAFGVHVIITARRWDEVPNSIVRLVLGRIELQLDDPAESRISPDMASAIPERPGWGIHNGQRFVAALPRLDDRDTDYDINAVVETLVSQSSAIAPSYRAYLSPEPSDLFALLGLGDPMTFDIAQAWRPRPKSDRYRIPFGIGEQGKLVELDIKEAAQQGMGPHGLCIGRTGSGKSEFLRTVLLGLLATHSSSTLNMILVDFKGGATYLGLDAAPHVAAVITNLASDLTQIDRMIDALAGEVVRRQELLAKGNYANVWDYENARENGAQLDPLPALFICIDEFSELLNEKPDFIDVLLQIGRLGRSLRIHMLLASHRLEEGKLRGLDTFLSYRIGLKTFSAAESRAVLGVPDAYDLPDIPGSGYLKYDPTVPMVRFKAAYVSGPYRSTPSSGNGESSSAADTPSVLEVVVGRFAGQGPPAYHMWLPPLDEPPWLDQLLPPLSPTDDRGLVSAGFVYNGRLGIPVGIVDKPFEHRRDVLWADFSGALGHGVVVGGPQAGKSMLLRTLVMSMALTHTPEEVQFYCLDFGGGTLTSLRGLPHVGDVAGRSDPDKARRMVAELTNLLAAREQRFHDLGIDSMTEFRNRKRRGGIPDDPYGDVFLLVDGWMTFRQEFEALEPMVVNLATQGLLYGVHVIIAATRWAEIRPALKDFLGTRFELRLGDPTESDIDRRVAVKVPAGRPGRGLSREKLHFLTALPRLDASTASTNPKDIDAGIADAVAKVAGAWRGRPAPQVRMLPQLLPYEQLPPVQAAPSPGLIPIGINEDALAPVYLDFDAESHFVAFADGQSGKTNLLRAICKGIVERFTPAQARILLVDYRRTMLGFITTEHVIGYAVSAQQLESMVDDVRASMSRRFPDPDVTQEQLKNRSWWRGPELYVIVDDYDLVATQSGNPLHGLAEYLTQAKDIGLHMVIARRTGGASRAVYDPILGKLHELGTPGIVMNGSQEEGALLGNVKPGPMPPGRGTIVSRKLGVQLAQIAWVPPDEPPLAVGDHGVAAGRPVRGADGQDMN